MRRRIATATSSSRPAHGGEHEHPAAGAGDGEVRLVPELPAQPRHQPELVGMGGGKHQRIEAQHRGFVMVGPLLTLQHAADALVQRGQALLFGAQSLR
jgi:hypothetical protein